MNKLFNRDLDDITHIKFRGEDNFRRIVNIEKEGVDGIYLLVKEEDGLSYADGEPRYMKYVTFASNLDAVRVE